MAPDDLIALLDAATALPGKDAVEAFEHSLGVTLPKDYRRFLAASPGGGLDARVNFPMGVEQDHLSRVLGLGARGRCSIEACFAEDSGDETFPEGLLRIMENGAGDAIVIVVRPDRLGEILFLDHEVADDDQPKPTIEIAESDDWGYALPLAPDFTAFVAGLACEGR